MMLMMTATTTTMTIDKVGTFCKIMIRFHS